MEPVYIGSPGTAARQVGASISLALRRFTRSRFLFVCLLFALVPIMIAIGMTMFTSVASESLREVHGVYEMLLHTVYLHFVILFTPFIFGMLVMRQDIDDQTLHFLVLQPIDRALIILGKYAAYLMLAFAICAVSLWSFYFILCISRFGVGAVFSDLFSSGRIFVLLRETGVMLLALMAYGAIALVASSFFGSVWFSLFVFVWETGLAYLPSSLKLWTVSHYLHSLLPEPLLRDRNNIQFLGQSSSVVVCLAVLIGVSIVMVSLAAVLYRTRECVYGEG